MKKPLWLGISAREETKEDWKPVPGLRMIGGITRAVVRVSRGREEEEDET